MTSSVVLASNAADSAAIDAIVQHHAELVGTVVAHSTALLDASSAGSIDGASQARRELVLFCRGELLPHAIAEEDTLYALARSLPETRLLVDAMIAEHRTLADLIDDLAGATTPLGASAAAHALRVLFELHADKENEFILPALAQSSAVSLSEGLDQMHRTFSELQAAAQGGGGCGGGCGCGGGGCGCGGHGHGGDEAHDEPAQAEAGGCACGGHDEPGRPVLDARQVEALTGARNYAGGWIDRSGGVLNPVDYARGLADAAEAAGARIFERSRVTGIRRDAGSYRLTTAKGEVRAGKVFVATNAYGGPLFPQLARSYFPLRVFQIATRPLAVAARQRLLPGNQCVSDTRRNLFTFRFDADNRLISGGMHVFGPGAAARVPGAIHRRLAQKLDLPDIPPIEYAWSGMAAVAPDFLSHLADLGPGMIAGFACNGRGIAMTTAMGAVVADWAAGADPDTLPIPCAKPRAIPLHGLLRHAPNVLLPWSMLRDRLDETSAG